MNLEAVVSLPVSLANETATKPATKPDETAILSDFFLEFYGAGFREGSRNHFRILGGGDFSIQKQ